MNRKGLGECTPTSCPKAGIKIHYSDNDYRQNPFSNQSKLTNPISFKNSTLNSLDLDLENYSLDDLYHLFNINQGILSEQSLKSAKQIVLKMHPDKSQLDSKYFLFFSKAYKRLFSIYEFQNRSSKKEFKESYDYYDDTNKIILDNFIENNKNIKDPKNFNNWFNNAFEKHRINNPIEDGYGEWLKSDEDYISINENVTKGNMNEIFEQKKKQIQSLTVYNGINDVFSSTFGGSLLDGSDVGSSDYTDLREAYTQTLIPVTMEDYNKIEKFNNLNEYKSHRDNINITPLSKEEAEKKLLYQQKQQDQHSAALAFKYAKETEKIKEKQKDFWSDLKQITGW